MTSDDRIKKIKKLKEYLDNPENNFQDLINLFYGVLNCEDIDCFPQKAKIETVKKVLDIEDITWAGMSENAINRLVETFNNHYDVDSVLAKVVLINTFYSTNLLTFGPKEEDGKRHMTVSEMAKWITSLDKDRKLTGLIESGNEYEAVILLGETPDKYNDAYSFASKYCNWHKQGKFPIIDSYTRGFLYYWHKVNLTAKYTQTELRDYKTFCEAYKVFKKSVRGSSEDAKKMDSFLWAYGKAANLSYD